MKTLALAQMLFLLVGLDYGLAANGSQGVTEIVDILTAELRRIMSATGCKSLAEIDESVLVTRDYSICKCKGKILFLRQMIPSALADS